MPSYRIIRLAWGLWTAGGPLPVDLYSKLLSAGLLPEALLAAFEQGLTPDDVIGAVKYRQEKLSTLGATYRREEWIVTYDDCPFCAYLDEDEELDPEYYCFYCGEPLCDHCAILDEDFFVCHRCVAEDE